MNELILGLQKACRKKGLTKCQVEVLISGEDESLKPRWRPDEELEL